MKCVAMPKSNKPPRYCKNGKYAIVYVNGKKHYLGLYGSTESRQEYARVVAEWNINPILLPTDTESSVSVSELAAGFLDHFQSRCDKVEFGHNKYAIGYLVQVYGSLAANDFSPKKLKVVRTQMIKTERVPKAHQQLYSTNRPCFFMGCRIGIRQTGHRCCFAGSESPAKGGGGDI